MCYLSFKYLRYSSSPDYIYLVNFGPLKDWQLNNLSIKKNVCVKGGKLCLASISSGKRVGVKVFVNSSPGATRLQKLFFPVQPQRQGSMEGKNQQNQNH